MTEDFEDRFKRIEAKVKTLADIEDKAKALEARVRTLEDIQEINKLQRIYGYYLDDKMYDEAADLFADEGASIDMGSFAYIGKEGVRRFLRSMIPEGVTQEEVKRWLSLHMQLQGVVDVNPDGKTAKGRWQMFCMAGRPDTEDSLMQHGVYEDEYVKEGGKWKIKTLLYHASFITTLKEGWAKKPCMILEGLTLAEPDIWRDTNDFTGFVNTFYPSGYIFPYHFKNPVTER